MMRIALVMTVVMGLGFFGGLFYASLTGGPAPAPIPVAAPNFSVPDATDAAAAASVLRARQMRDQRRRMRAEAEAFLSELDEAGCTLDPAQYDRYADTGSYSMQFDLPDGGERTFEMTGAQFKGFAVDAAAELKLSNLDCDQSGRYFQVEKDTVRVLEKRRIEARFNGEIVEIQQKRNLVLRQDDDGRWKIQEIKGVARIR